MRTSTRHYAIAAIFMAALFLAGCAGPGPGAVIEEIGEDASSGAYIPGVPVIEQRTGTCGPAALATVFAYYAGKSGPPGPPGPPGPGMEDVADAVFNEDLGGSLPVDLFLFARESGYGAKYYRGSIDDLRENISAGRPLILFLDLGTGPVRAGHYVVAVGYGDTSGLVILHTGTNREETMTYGRLDRSWSRTDYSTLLVTPRGDASP